jgi:PAP2 superfamily
LSTSYEWTKNVCYWVSGLLALAAVPLLKHFHLPLRFDWAGLAYMYWVLLAERAIFAAVILCLIGFPRTIWMPALDRIWGEKLRIILLLVFLTVLWWNFGGAHALILTVDSVAILELRERLKSRGWGRVTGVLLPALYLFAGLLLVSAYNDIILSSRFFAAADTMFDSLDRWLLRGLSVSHISHWGLQVFPLSVFRFLEFVYFSLFSQIGAGLILISIARGRRRGLQFVGAILIGYYLALGLFYLWPSQGPYYLCPNHFSEFPATLKTYAVQMGSIAGARARWNHEPLNRMSFDYYIAFPCMHIAQPLIVMWFLRPWHRTIAFLAVYNTVLLIAIVLLEWHYIVDILAGFVVAAAAIAVSESSNWWRGSASNGSGVAPVGECAASS